MIRLGRLMITSALLLGLPLTAWAGNTASFSSTVPAGQKKSIKINSLPKDTVVAVEVQSDGPIEVVFLGGSELTPTMGEGPALFRGETERKLGFSVTTPAEGDYFVVFNNAHGAVSRSVVVTVTATRRLGSAKPPAMARLRTAERTLKAFEARLNLALIFTPLPIKIRACPGASSFIRTETLVLCAAYVQRLYAAFPDRRQAADALLFAMYHEIAHLLLTQWKHPQAAQEETADEFATALMVMFELGAKARAHADAWISDKVAADQVIQAFPQDPHVLTRDRAIALRQWVADMELAAKWQPVVVPHMQTALLERLSQEPQSWTQLDLVSQELAVRKRGKTLTF
jgi:hypothetical protein